MTHARQLAMAAVLIFLIAPAFAASAADEPAAVDILIATEKSDFKQAVVRDVEQHVKAAGLSSRVVTLKALHEANLADHKAVVILNAIWAWRLRRAVRAFLKNVPDDLRSRVILINTAAQTSWKTKETGVHALTSASRKNDRQKVVDFVCTRIDALTGDETKEQSN